METERRLIDANDIDYENIMCSQSQLYWLHSIIEKQPTVDAVPVDKITLHHILIDNEGVPEVKLQIGDRYFRLRTAPLDVMEVVHGRWIEYKSFMECSECGTHWYYGDNDCHLFDYCPNCGAKMDGDE